MKKLVAGRTVVSLEHVVAAEGTVRVERFEEGVGERRHARTTAAGELGKVSSKRLFARS